MIQCFLCLSIQTFDLLCKLMLIIDYSLNGGLLCTLGSTLLPTASRAERHL